MLVKTTIKTMPTSKIHFTYECLHGDKVLTTAETTLVFVNKSTIRPTRCPDDLLVALQPFFT
ncbi:MAG: acyl-CoA thioester hydrolase [Flavobacteriales bacterium]